jgi:CBS domain-containing protein
VITTFISAIRSGYQAKRRDIMQVREVMAADVHWCTVEDSAQKAAQVMKDADTGVIPIINNDQERKVIGIVTDRDLCLRIVADATDSRQVKVGDLLSDEIVACHIEDEAQDAADNMAVYQVRRLPVLDNDDRLVGIVSIGDLSREEAIGPEDSGEVLASISEPNEAASSAPAGRKSR